MFWRESAQKLVPGLSSKRQNIKMTCFPESEGVQHFSDVGEGVLRQVDAERFVPNGRSSED
jgi:hypothetical protein